MLYHQIHTLKYAQYYNTLYTFKDIWTLHNFISVTNKILDPHEKRVIWTGQKERKWRANLKTGSTKSGGNDIMAS